MEERERGRDCSHVLLSLSPSLSGVSALSLGLSRGPAFAFRNSHLPKPRGIGPGLSRVLLLPLSRIFMLSYTCPCEAAAGSTLFFSTACVAALVKARRRPGAIVKTSSSSSSRGGRFRPAKLVESLEKRSKIKIAARVKNYSVRGIARQNSPSMSWRKKTSSDEEARKKRVEKPARERIIPRGR